MESSLVFGFGDLSEEDFSYSACYFGDEKLLVEKREYVQKYDPTRGISIPKFVKLGQVDDPWGIFCENAIFLNIYQALSLYRERDKYNEKDDPENWLRPYKHVKLTLKNGREINSVAEDDGAFLRAISDNPDRLLYNTDALHRFVRILWSAKTGVMPTYITLTQKEIKELLRENLIPKHRGGRKYLPQDTELCRALMKKLTQHLSSRCIDYLKKHGLFTDIKDIYEKEVWELNYDKLIEWAEKSEPRISYLNRRQLKDLVKNPADYADSLLEEYLKVSLRTINTPNSAK